MLAKTMKGWLAAIGLVILGLFFMGMSNSLPMKDEAVTAAWSQVDNQYQRRMDLIPNLVDTVKGYVGHENTTLVRVTEARASATQIKVEGDLVKNPVAMQQYAQAQAQITASMPALMALGRQVQEQYPNLKADVQFTNLTSALEGTENRIAVARRDYIKAVQDFNGTIRTFPFNVINGLTYQLAVRPNFTADEAAAKAPRVGAFQ